MSFTYTMLQPLGLKHCALINQNKNYRLAEFRSIEPTTRIE